MCLVMADLHSTIVLYSRIKSRKRLAMVLVYFRYWSNSLSQLSNTTSVVIISYGFACFSSRSEFSPEEHNSQLFGLAAAVNILYPVSLKQYIYAPNMPLILLHDLYLSLSSIPHQNPWNRYVEAIKTGLLGGIVAVCGRSLLLTSYLKELLWE